MIVEDRVQTRFQRFEESVRLLQKLWRWKVDCPRIKYKNKESKIEANVARVINTLSDSTSQAGGSDSDSTVFFFRHYSYYWLLRQF